jgi:Caspase domain
MRRVKGILVFLGSVGLFHAEILFGQDTLDKKIPILVVSDSSVTFSDNDGNGRLDAGEIATVEFILTNKGTATASGLKSSSTWSAGERDITAVTLGIGNLAPGKQETVTTILKAGLDVPTGRAILRITIKEPNGYDCEPLEVSFSTLAFQIPHIVAVDGIFSSESGGKLRVNYPAHLEVLVQNTGSGNAEEITADVKLPDGIVTLDPPHLPIARLRPGESVRLNTIFIVTARYADQNVPIKIVLKEKHQRYGSETVFTTKLDQQLEITRVNVNSEQFTPVTVVPASLHADVDVDIPVNIGSKNNRFALVIGNEDYQHYQTGLESDQNVAYARNDAIVFKEYLIKMLGFPEKQVFLLTDATRGPMNRELERITELAKLSPGAELVFYYAGHGLPDLNTHQGYILPVDITASDLKDGLRLGDLYSRLASCQASRVTVFLDACFSGGGRGENGLLAARTVKIKPTGDVINGNVIVFAATSGDEVSLPFDKESHGLFTYYLLHKLKETKGNVTMKDLGDYLHSEIPKTALMNNVTKQEPQLLVAPDLGDQWTAWRFVQ